MSDNITNLSGRKGLADNLFENTVRAATAADADSEVFTKLARDYRIGAAVPFGAASFYDHLSRDHRDKLALVCNGSSCLCAGTQDDLRARLTQRFGPAAIGTITCLGRCHENGSFQYRGCNYSGDDIDRLETLVDRPQEIAAGAYHVQSLIDPPILTAPFPGVAEYYRSFDCIHRRSPANVLAEVAESGLRGRGGAGFPTAAKWGACRAAPAAEKYIICNADEGDPGAYIDRYLMEQRPHSLLFGMLVAGYCVGAQYGVIYVRAEYPQSRETLAAAIHELEQAGYTGENIKGTGLDFSFKIIGGAGAYICGEETALLASVEGRRPEPSVRPPYPTTYGLFGKPTIVNNVESLACVHHIVSHGGESFRRIGTGASTGPKLVSLDASFNRPGIYEVPLGTPLDTIVTDLGAGFRTPVKAVQIGGPLGAVVPVARIALLNFDFESLEEGGFLLGHGGIIGIPRSMPIIDYMHHLMTFCADESCGKCFPCCLGSVRGAEMLRRAADRQVPLNRRLFADLLETLELGSLCGLGGGIPLPLRNILDHFGDELRDYHDEVVQK